MSSERRPANVAASVRARLLALSRARQVEFQLVLAEFGIERLLYRLSVSPHADQFVLKGAMLFKLWSIAPHRATWDLDLLGRGDNSIAGITEAIRDLCGVVVDDGIIFDAASLVGEEIRAADEYAGVRVRFEARLMEARIPMQIDVGFGDTIVPPATWQLYPVLLHHPPPRILAYPRETVVAEKVEAMVSLGVTNSRMKDFYDVQRLAASFTFEGPMLVDAIRATFGRRGTPIPQETPVALTRDFLAAPERQTQWRAFLRRGRLAAPPDTAVLAGDLWRFLQPILMAAASGKAAPGRWTAGGPWDPGP